MKPFYDIGATRIEVGGRDVDDERRWGEKVRVAVLDVWIPGVDMGTVEMHEDEARAFAAEIVAVFERCCDLHRKDGCCDPEDCGPCCENCPTCPTLARHRAEETDAAPLGDGGRRGD